jgi:hypothetical protein
VRSRSSSSSSSGGVVHQDVQATQPLHGLRDDAPAHLALANVAGQQHGGAALSAYQRGDRLGVHLLLWQVAERHVRTLAGERDRHRGADAGVASRDEGLAPRQAAQAAVGLLAVIGLGVELRVQTGNRLPRGVRHDVRVALHRVVEGELIGHVLS